MQILRPAKPESWRVALTVHAKAIHQVLNGEMLRLAADGGGMTAVRHSVGEAGQNRW